MNDSTAANNILRPRQADADPQLRVVAIPAAALPRSLRVTTSPVSPHAVSEMQAMLRAQGQAADPLQVVHAHVAAVHSKDPVLMAADYACGARITRGADCVDPAMYFAQAVQRLGSSQLCVHALRQEDNSPERPDLSRIVMEWELQGDRAHGTRGTDTFYVSGDRIVDQQVVLHTADF